MRGEESRLPRLSLSWPWQTCSLGRGPLLPPARLLGDRFAFHGTPHARYLLHHPAWAAKLSTAPKATALSSSHIALQRYVREIAFLPGPQKQCPLPLSRPPLGVCVCVCWCRCVCLCVCVCAGVYTHREHQSMQGLFCPFSTPDGMHVCV